MSDRITNTIQDIKTIESLEELESYKQEVAESDLAGNEEIQAAFAQVEERLGKVDLAAEVARLRAKLAERQAAGPKPERRRVARVENKYRILSTDVKWANPKLHQVHAVAKILHENFRVGEVYSESEILNAMVKNRPMMRTVQPAKKIWDYYKGNSANGLMAHRNIELVVEGFEGADE